MNTDSKNPEMLKTLSVTIPCGVTPFWVFLRVQSWRTFLKDLIYPIPSWKAQTQTYWHNRYKIPTK